MTYVYIHIRERTQAAKASHTCLILTRASSPAKALHLCAHTRFCLSHATGDMAMASAASYGLWPLRCAYVPALMLCHSQYRDPAMAARCDGSKHMPEGSRTAERHHCFAPSFPASIAPERNRQRSCVCMSCASGARVPAYTHVCKQ